MDFIAELLVGSDRRTWRGDEVVKLTANALHPVSDVDPGIVVSAVKIITAGGGSRYSELTSDDWSALHQAWQAVGLATPSDHMTEDEWLPYVLAFNEDPGRPGWEFGIMPPVDSQQRERLSRAATQQEHTSILTRAIASGSVLAINPLTGASAGELSRLEAVALRRDGLAQFCAMVSIRLVTSEASEEQQLPRFAIPVRPRDVPGALRALEPDQRVRYDHGSSCGITGSGIQSASDLIAQFDDVMARQRLGAFHPDEAAHLVAEAQAFDSRTFLQQLKEAHRAGALTVRAPDTELPRKASDPWRPNSDIVKVSDLNAWLQVQGVSYLFPGMELLANHPLSRAGQDLTDLIEEDGVLGVYRQHRAEPSEALKSQPPSPGKTTSTRDSWIGHSTARRRFDGESWIYEDLQNQSFAIDLLLHGQSLIILDAFIERLEGEGAPAGSELRNRRLDAWENRSNREIFKRHVEWILLRKREIEAWEKSNAEIGRLTATLEARAADTPGKSASASHQEPLSELTPQRRNDAVSVRHSTISRREDLLTPVLRKAEEMAGSGASAAQVWAQLEHMARAADRPAPLANVTSGGVVYFDGATKRTFTLAALRDRLRRARTRGSTL